VSRDEGGEGNEGGPGLTPRFSVVIPAWNEERVIGRTLERLLADVHRPDEIEVIVVCNGCTDDTAAVATRVGGPVQVVETPIGSKPHALNLGDAAATVFPRLYLDADIELTTEAARCLVAALEAGEGVAVSPRLELDLRRSGPVVRSYSRIWSRLPSIEQGLAGRGVYALSAEGRARFGSFPEVLGDDLFIDRLYRGRGARCIGEAAVTVRMPHRTVDLVRRKTRVFVGIRELVDHDNALTGLSGEDRYAWLRVVRGDLQLVVHVPAYLLVTLWAKLRARRAHGRRGGWERDESAREGP
jgi:glycosyltransferase involved in cell wall biosynthesis